MSSKIAKRIAESYLKKQGCLFNDPASLPEVGQTVDRIVQQEGSVDIYFNDGSFVSAEIETDKPKACGCGKTASREWLNLVAVVQNNELLGAEDIAAVGAKDPAVWTFMGVEPPFEMYVLRQVPLDLAEELVDFGTRASRLRDGKKVWRQVKTYADSSPFKRM